MLFKTFNLPNPRKEYPCKNKRQNGPGLCDQMIYQSTTRKHTSGKYMVLNAENGRGGKRDDPHVCPDRVGSAFHNPGEVNILEYRWHLQHMPCSMCGGKYNQEVYPLCPVCMKLECRKCGNRQNWIIDKGMNCFVCGGRCDPIKVRRLI